MIEFLTNLVGQLFDFVMSLLTVITDGFGFILSIFLFIPKIIIFDFFNNLPFYFQYGLYSLFCVLIFVLVVKLFSLIFVK